jgi:hypothetical protein
MNSGDMNDQTFTLLMSKLTSMHQDITQFQTALQNHLDDKDPHPRLSREVWVVKRVGQAILTVLTLALGYLGWKSQ